MEIDVDGERFAVTRRDSGYDFDWLSHRHGYGFSCSQSDGSAMSTEEVVAEIRAFLAGINPETGYLD